VHAAELAQAPSVQALSEPHLKHPAAPWTHCFTLPSLHDACPVTHSPQAGSAEPAGAIGSAVELPPALAGAFGAMVALSAGAPVALPDDASLTLPDGADVALAPIVGVGAVSVPLALERTLNS
jgi:hypothetical protein